MKPKSRRSFGYLLATAILATGLSLPPEKAAAQEPYLGQLMLFAGNFCPRGWSNANGALLSINSDTALFSLYGTYYGGDGRTTFGLPDLRGRAPVHNGQGPGLSSISIGSRGGVENTTLTVNQMPAHNHIVNATNQLGNKLGPGTDYLADPPPINGVDLQIYHDGPPNRQMDPGMIATSGSGQGFDNRSPLLAMTWCVARTGVYPSRP